MRWVMVHILSVLYRKGGREEGLNIFALPESPNKYS